IVVTAEVVLQIGHGVGAWDEIDLAINESTTNCPISGNAGVFVVPSPEPTATYLMTVMFSNQFSVTAAGTKTYNVNGLAVSGGGTNDYFLGGNVVVVFYPS
ncbi:MAG TPA: hypothetical protein VEM95_06650, partial [Thermoplasmata archaeon]|nr:hypothetical protein [Thermoplasmata archaeon]